MSCHNCQCNNCKLVRQHEMFNDKFFGYAKKNADETRRMWNIQFDKYGCIPQSEVDRVKQIIAYGLAEDYYGLPKVPQDNYTCSSCGCQKLCTQTDIKCWKCGEPVQS